MNHRTVIRSLSNGVNQKGVRDHNERLILSTLHRHGEMPGSDIARHTNLSAQTVSVILRKLESDGILIKGTPLKGKVGKPSVPMTLNPDGVYSIGFKLGRRSSEFFLMNLCGEILMERRIRYKVALPSFVFAFMREGFEAATQILGPHRMAKLCGIGIAVPLEIWKWGASDGALNDAFQLWKDIDFEKEILEFTPLPVFMINDATAACWAEHVYGRGKEFRDYCYLFVSTFIGGGIVINQSVYEGPHGNAGAFGPIRVIDKKGCARPLLDVSSIHLLETALTDAGHDSRSLWDIPQDWSVFETQVADWIDTTAFGLAQAIISASAVVDFEAVLIDGAIPPGVRHRLVEALQNHLPQQDARGLILPNIEEGVIGSEARAIGAASGPIFAQFFLTAKMSP